MSNTNEVIVSLKGKDEVSDKVKKVEKSFLSLKNVAIGAFAVFATKKIYDFGKACLQSAREAELLNAGFENSISSITNWGVGIEKSDQLIKDTTESLAKYASAMAYKTGIDDDQIKASMGLIATYGVLPGSIGDLAHASVQASIGMQMQTGQAQNLSAISETLSRAVKGNFLGLKSLGVVLTETQKEQLALATEQERAGLIAEMMTERYGTAVNTFVETTEGKLQRAKTQWGELQEAIGEKLVIVQGAVATVALPVFDKMIKAMENVNSSWDVNGEELTSTMTKIAEDAVYIIGIGVPDAYNLAVNKIEGFVESWILTIDIIGDKWGWLANEIGDKVDSVVGIYDDLTGAIDKVGKKISDFVSGGNKDMKNLGETIDATSRKSQGALKDLASQFDTTKTEAKNSIYTLTTDISADMSTFVSKSLDWGAHFLDNFITGVNNKKGALSVAVAGAKAILNILKFSTNPDIPSEVWGAHFIENFSGGINSALPQLSADVQKVIDVLNGVSDAQKEVADVSIDSLREMEREYSSTFNSLQSQISKFQSTLADIMGDYSNTEKDERQRVAEAIVATDERILELQKQMFEEEEESKILKIREQIRKEQDAKQKLKDRIITFDNEVKEVKRVNNLTELQRAFENFDSQMQQAKELRDEKLSALREELSESQETWLKLQELHAQKTETVKKLLGEEGSAVDQLQAKLNNSYSQMVNLLNMVNNVKSQIGSSSSVSLPSRPSGGSSSMWNDAKTSKKASGGSVYSGRSYLVGEKGVEIFKPKIDGDIIPNKAIGGNNMTIIVNNNGNISSKEIAMQYAEIMVQKLKLKLNARLF